MSVKLILLKSGENIISDVKEGFFEERMVCYLLDNPCIVSLGDTYESIGDEDDSGNKISISLYPWPSLSKQNVIELSPDWVITIVEPNEYIKEMYETRVLGIKQNESNKNTAINEQSDSNQSD